VAVGGGWVPGEWGGVSGVGGGGGGGGGQSWERRRIAAGKDARGPWKTEEKEQTHGQTGTCEYCIAFIPILVDFKRGEPRCETLSRPYTQSNKKDRPMDS